MEREKSICFFLNSRSALISWTCSCDGRFSVDVRFCDKARRGDGRLFIPGRANTPWRVSPHCERIEGPEY